MVFSPLIANRLRESDHLLFLLTEHIEKTKRVKKMKEEMITND